MQQQREKIGLFETPGLRAAAKRQKVWLEDPSLYFLECPWCFLTAAFSSVAVVVVVVVEASAPKVYPRVTLASASTLFVVGGKDLEGWRRTSKYVLSSCIEPGAPPKPVFDRLRLLFEKRTQGSR